MRKEESKFTTKFVSEPGTKPKNNDYFGYVQLDNYAVWAIADGYDEEDGAAIASKLAVESAIEYFMLRPRFNPEVIKEMMEYANLKVKEKQEETECYSLMHTSLLIVISNYNSILYGNVGNTRFYHLRGGYVMYQSSDDSIAQLLVEEGALNTRDMKYHRQRNDLLQAIGDFGKIKPNVIKHPVQLQEKDVLCLTTMGFWENIDEREMEVELSRYDDKSKWLRSLERKIIATLRDEVENYTFAAVSIEGVAAPEPVEKDKKKFWIKVALISLVILLLILMLTFWNIKKRNDIIKKATTYEQMADEDLVKKDFNNSMEELKLSIGEYEKLKPKSRGIIGFFVNAKNRRADADKRIDGVKKKIEQTEKLKQAFQDISEGNEFFNGGRYDEASRKYQQAKYNLEQNTYKKDELNTEEILVTLNTRIDSSSKLKEAQSMELAGDSAYTAGNYNLAKESYKTASDIYLVNGRPDYVSSMERKISEINDKEKTAYSGAMLTENRGDILAPTDSNMSREAYYQARQMYQVLGDSAKTQEIDNKIQELNSRQIANLQTASNMVKEGLDQITANNPSEAIALLTKAKAIYQGLQDTNNVSNVDNYIKQAQEFIKFESDTKTQLANQEKQSKLEIQAKENEIIAEKERLEKIAKDIENATNLEIQGDQMFSLKRYTESIQKYSEAKKIFENLKAAGNFNDQTNKIDYLGKKIIKSEGYLYEEQGDTEGKNKKWKEAEKKYQMSKDNMELLDVSTEDKKRVEKKLKNATKKANKKWWEFWK
jgi:putative tetratricopeptide repeat domain protein (fragment)